MMMWQFGRLLGLQEAYGLEHLPVLLLVLDLLQHSLHHLDAADQLFLVLLQLLALDGVQLLGQPAVPEVHDPVQDADLAGAVDCYFAGGAGVGIFAVGEEDGLGGGVLGVVVELEGVGLDLDGVQRTGDVAVFVLAELVQAVSGVGLGLAVRHLEHVLSQLALPLLPFYLEHANNETLIFINKPYPLINL